jgi:hypothetical protein
MIYFISGDDFVNSEEKRLPKQPLFSFLLKILQRKLISALYNDSEHHLIGWFGRRIPWRLINQWIIRPDRFIDWP